MNFRLNLCAIALISIVASCNKGDALISSNLRSSEDVQEARKGNGGGGTSVNINQGLIAYYPFNGNAKDATNNRFDGVVNRATLTMDRFGVKNRAYSFDGRTSYIYANGLNQTYFENTDFSISLYVNPLNFVSDYAYLAWGENAFLGIDISGGSNSDEYIGTVGFGVGEQAEPYPTPNGQLRTRNKIQLNRWQNLVITKSGLTMSLYIDGNLFASAPYYETGRRLIAGAGMFFGNAQSTGFTYGFAGSMDEIRFYNRALTAPEIIYLANN